ncbi:hypothetical protein Ga0058931_1977 [Roseibaca calidilacus]|uniref:Uncharacterized protein n=1 Tax=Roseibaca calidilacus TaxID=1666912 RepID=A0ABM9VU61_9RHOB|nr:hypothetical protein Ga0058931_1977 [Roseibaca calidilacus]
MKRLFSNMLFILNTSHAAIGIMNKILLNDFSFDLSENQKWSNAERAFWSTK